jgi:RecA-family ATPase
MGLGGLARALDGIVITNGHPSRSGQSTGSGEFGSIQWDAAFRSRLYLQTPKGNGETPDFFVRTLTRKKANHALREDTIPLQWKDGVFVNTDHTGIIGAIERRTCKRIFLDLLDKTSTENQPVSSSSRAGNYAPKLFASRPEAQGYSKADFEKAMQACFSNRNITNIDYGRKGDERTRIACL